MRRSGDAHERPGVGERQRERALKFAVLEDALKILLAVPTSGSDRDLWDQTLDWLNRPGLDHPFDFEALCAALTIDAGALRQGVLAEIGGRPGGRPRARPLKIGGRGRNS